MRPMILTTFFCGIGNALEIFPVPHVYEVRRPFAGYSDAQLIASDWNRVGQAFYAAMDATVRETAGVEEEEAGRR